MAHSPGRMALNSAGCERFLAPDPTPGARNRGVSWLGSYPELGFAEIVQGIRDAGQAASGRNGNVEHSAIAADDGAQPG